ncbi:MAG: cytidyltransferase-related domain protein [Lachnospiraceae bacterium]|nr:cytidyltransferase-related domain protein [Lachnospiraceae bacterium]
MHSRNIRHLATKLLAGLFDRDFLKSSGLSRRTMQGLFDRERWETVLEEIFPVQKRFTCAEILELCRPELSRLSPEPEEGWLSFTYTFSTHILYPDQEFSGQAAPFAAGALLFLKILQFFFDEERKVLPFDPFDDFAFLTEEEYKSFDRADEYAHFVEKFRKQYIYEMMRLNREATPFETLGHIAGVHHVAMTVARGLYRAGVPIDLALASGAAAGHDLGKFGCKPNERVPYLHYYYTHQWFFAYHMDSIGHIAANHSTWDLELDNISVESLVLIYADFRVKQMRDEKGREITKIYSLKDSFDVILSKLDNVDEAKRNRYRVVYMRLYEFERYMRLKGVDVDLDGSAPSPKKPLEIVLQNGKQIIGSFVSFGIEHNIDVMQRLGTERQFGNILEAARSEKDWKNVRAYLNMFNEYSIHLNHKQKEQTLNFLYELLLNREGDIRRQAAALMGKIFADFNAGYRKEIPVGMPDADEGKLLSLWEEYLGMLVCPDYRLTLQQKQRIQNSLKFVLISVMERGSETLREEFFVVFMRWFDKGRELGEDSTFYLLDAVFSMPPELCGRKDWLDRLVLFAVERMEDSKGKVRVAAIRCLRILTEAVTPESACYEAVCGAARNMKPDSMTMLFLQYRLFTNLGLDTTAQQEILYGRDVVSDIFLENLKSATPWILKAINIKLLADQVDHGKHEHLLHICAHFSNLIKVSEQVGVRHDAGHALLRLAHLLTTDQRNEIAVELLKGLEVGEYEFSKYIPEYLGEFALWLPPEQLDDLIERLHTLLANGNERIVSVALDTLGVLLECYACYPERFEEKGESAQERRMRLLGFVLSCLANYREQVRQEAMLVIGHHIFGSSKMSEQDKNELFSLCSKKLLFLLNENKGGELSLYYRAATLSHIYRFVTRYQIFTGDVNLKEREKVAFFPGTFDPFTLSHKEIAREIRSLGFTVFLAVDEFSWSKKTQPHLVRRQIVNMSVADEFYVHLFPDEISVNIANPKDLKRLKEVFKEQELYIVVGSDVIHNASSYKKEPSENSIHGFHHLVFRRAGEENPADLYKCLTGKVVELELPAALEDISSTKIRENIDNHRDISSLIDPVVQEYIYHKGLYLREPEFKPILRAKAVTFEKVSGSDGRVLGELANTVLYRHPEASSILSKIRENEERLIVLRNAAERAQPVGFASYRELNSEELFGVLRNMDLANAVRRKSSREVPLITGIYVRESSIHDGEAIRDSAQLLLVEVLTQALEKNRSAAMYVAERSLTSDEVISALERQGFVRPYLADDSERRTVYVVDMHEPLLLLHNLETTIKEPFASSRVILEAVEKNHKKLQLAMTKLYPGNLVLSLSSGIMHHRLVDRITALNEVPREPLTPRRLGENMCVPFGKILRGKVVPNTVTKTLHTDKVYEPDLNSYSIEPFPYYSPLKGQIETIKSFGRPVILVDDLVHKADRLQALAPSLREAGIPIKKVVVGVTSGYGRDLMQAFKLPVESIYSMPNLRQWFLESTLYPFIGGDTVRREEMKVAGLQSSVNMILPYAAPRLSGCSREALFEFSACCIENSRDLFRVLEAEYRRQFAKNLTLSRLSEAVILPLCPDKGSCMEYDENLAASVYLENDLEMLWRMRKYMVTE